MVGNSKEGVISAPKVHAKEHIHIKKTRDKAKISCDKDCRSFDDLKALCLSGGGIRSAAFSMGVLQAFAEKRLMKKFDYVSAVSGGGYALGWWSAIVKRHCDDGTRDHANAAIRGLEKAEMDIASSFGGAHDPEPGLRDTFVRSYVRAHGNYLTVRTGLLSADTWAAFLTMVRNLVYGMAGLGLLFVIVARVIVAVLEWLFQNVNCGPGWLVILSGLAGCAGWGMTNLSMTANLKQQTTFWTANWAVVCLTVCAFLLATFLSVQDRYVLASENSGLASIVALTVIGVLTVIDLGLLFLIPRPVSLTLTSVRSVMGRFKSLLGLFALIGIVVVGSKIVLTPQNWFASMNQFFAASPKQPWLLWESFLVAHAWEYARARTILKEKEAANCDAGNRNRIADLAGFTIVLISLAVLIAAEPRLSLWFTGSMDSSNFWIHVGALVIGLLFAATTMSALAMVSEGTQSTQSSSQRREWWARWSGALLLCAFLTAAILCISQMVMLYCFNEAARWIVPAAIGSLACVALATQDSMHQGARLFIRGLGLLAVVLMIFVTFLAAVLLKGIDITAPLGIPVFFTVVSLGLAFAVLLRSGPNTFSMHELYRNRLVRAFLGASMPQPTEMVPYIDFSRNDDVDLVDLRAGKKEDSRSVVLRPFPIWCATVNVTDSSEIGLQERKAASFVFTPLHCGYQVTSVDRRPRTNQVSYAYAPSKHHGCDYNLTDESYEKEPLTVGTVVATSGAAFSSNTGASTKPERALLLTLLGFRLGRWFPNPAKYIVPATRQTSSKTPEPPPSSSWTAGIPVHIPGGPGQWRARCRAFGKPLILLEAFSRCDIHADSVYVTDGGHFENLGVYEMIRRRAALIVAFDAGCDPQFQFHDLLNLQTKVRTDFGVEIQIGDLNCFRLRGTDFAQSQVAEWKIEYPSEADGTAGPVGLLIYCKSTLTGKEPKDLLNYHKKVPTFPHISTINQWFAESAFEAYRTLGLHIGRQAASVFANRVLDARISQAPIRQGGF